MNDVLLVDDDEAFSASLRAILEAEGFSVDTAPDGQRALEKMKSAPPRVVLLDLFMPVMDGWALLARLREFPPLAKTPVFAYSGAAEASAPPDTPFLRKPLP